MSDIPHADNRFPLPYNPQPYIPPPKYGFFHDEGDGALHVCDLPGGTQGTVTLVRCSASGRLMIRKRRPSESDRAEVDLEVHLPNSINHPNVVKCFGYVKYPGTNSTRISAVTYWDYKNCGDVGVFYTMLTVAGISIPEIILWRYLRQLLGAMHAAHVLGICHNDAHKNNIFVNWQQDEPLPEFYLGDWGFANRYDGYDANQARNQPLSIGHGTTVPLPTLGSLHAFVRPETFSSDNPVRPAAGLEDISDDYGPLSETLRYMMGESTIPNSQASVNSYSLELNYVKALLENLHDGYLISDHVPTFAHYQHIFQLLYSHICQQETNCWGNYHTYAQSVWRAYSIVCPGALPIPGSTSTTQFTATQNDNHDEDDEVDDDDNDDYSFLPKLFSSTQEVEAYEYRPPGPWQVATVDPLTYQILLVDPTVHVAHEWKCTNGSRQVVHNLAANAPESWEAEHIDSQNSGADGWNIGDDDHTDGEDDGEEDWGEGEYEPEAGGEVDGEYEPEAGREFEGEEEQEIGGGEVEGEQEGQAQSGRS